MLHAVICFSDGSKRVIVDGVESAVDDAELSDAERDQVASVNYVAPEIKVPDSVTRFQARAALLEAGLLPQVESLMAAPTVSPIARLAWLEAQEFKRTSPTVAGMAAVLGLTDAEIDQLFIVAQGIEA